MNDAHVHEMQVQMWKANTWGVTEFEDDAEAQSPAPFLRAALWAMMQRTDAGTSSAILDSLYLGEDLLPIFAFSNCFIFWVFILIWFDYPSGFDEGPCRHRKNPCDPSGVDIVRIGLGVPLRPPLSGETPRPSGLGMEHDTGCSFWFFLSFSFSMPHALLTT